MLPISADADEAVRAIADQGYAVVRTGIPADEISSLKSALVEAIASEDDWHGTSERPDHAMVLVCPLYSPRFCEVLANDMIWEVTGRVLGAGAIVYAYTSSSMPPNRDNYSHRVHNDCPRSLGLPATNLGLTLPLDEFTEDNGATYLLPKSHRQPDAPSEAAFYGNALRFVAMPGTALLFDARLWHAGGTNNTDHWRHAITVNFCRSWMKQRLDLPRMLGAGYRSIVSVRAAQRLGYDCQTPASYFEYYQPAHRRPYSQPAE